MYCSPPGLVTITSPSSVCLTVSSVPFARTVRTSWPAVAATAVTSAFLAKTGASASLAVYSSADRSSFS